MSSAVITAKIGPGNTVTALAIPSVNKFEFNLEELILRIQSSDSPEKTQYYAIEAATTYTLVLTAGNFVLTVS